MARPPGARAAKTRDATEAQRRRAVEKREALLIAALRVTGECGWQEASIGRISAAAAVSSGTFYYYFDSREELLRQLLPFVFDRLLSEMRAQDPIEASLADFLRQRFTAFSTALSSRPEYLRLLRETKVFEPEVYARSMQALSSNQAALAQQQSASALGKVAHESVELFERLLQSLLISLTEFSAENGGTEAAFIVAREAFVSAVSSTLVQMGVNPTELGSRLGVAQH